MELQLHQHFKGTMLSYLKKNCSHHHHRATQSSVCVHLNEKHCTQALAVRCPLLSDQDSGLCQAVTAYLILQKQAQTGDAGRVKRSSPAGSTGKCTGLALQSGVEAGLYYCSLWLQDQSADLGHSAQSYISQRRSERSVCC